MPNTNETIHFLETQRLTTWWLWLIIIGLNILFAWIFVQQVILGTPVGNSPASDMQVILFFALMLFFTAVFLAVRLLTVIDQDGIRVMLFPFHFRYRIFRWKDIDRIRIVRYSPMADYGGWGIRWGRKGTAYNLSGNIGFYIDFSNGKSVLIGTCKPSELHQALEKTGITVSNETVHNQS
jgi:hypothetical protein